MKKATTAFLFAAMATIAAPRSDAQQTTTEARLEPIFPDTPQGLLWIEAEDAVSTNFASEATLDYGSSGFRILQLNADGKSGSAPFYAEYSFAVDSAGTWDLWIGGTPPGPRSELDASFVSPLRYSLDGGEPIALYREDVAVNERYSTTNYWFVASAPLELAAGVHTIRFEVSETRKYDSRFYLYLDAFFLVDRGSSAAAAPRSSLPPRFPRDMADRSIDQAYLSIPRYEYYIQGDPKDPDRYLLLAQVYSLIGDNGSAIKTLARGRVVAGDDIRFTLQAAKSRMWSGEIDEGLRLYREYLSSPGADREVWAEAAKISAWLMRYREAEALYEEAVRLFPGDDTLRVNQALTLLWAGKAKQGERLLAELWAEARDDPDRVLSLGGIYLVSGYPDKAIGAWTDGIELYPDRLELYFRLAEAYDRTARPELARDVIALAQGRFVPSQRLSESVAAFERQSGLRVLALEGYRARLERNPDDLDLREQLVRAYAWNGMLQEALEESGDVLVNKLYAIFAGLDGDLAETYRLLDLASVYEAPVATVAAEASAASGALKKDAEAFRRAKARLEQALKGKDAKRLAKAESDLASAAEALAGRLAEAAELTDRADWAFSGAEDLIGASVTEAASEGADAQMLSRLAPWTWDMSADLDFLSRRASENPLAWYCATKILMFEGKGAPPPPPAGRLAGADTLRLQAGLWSTGELDEDAFSAADWYGRGDELAAALASLAKGEVGAPPSGEALASLADEASAGLTALSARGSRAAADLRSAKASLLARARSRMRARAYQYDGETQQDRRALADMYLRLGKPEEAVKALSRVLAINPSDAASLFTLGRARETSGDWHGAMDAYGTVYDLNPRYESAVSSYNRLAGIHAPSVSAAITTVVDTARSSETARLEYTAPLGGAMELRSSYAVDRKKIHAPASGAFPASMTLHTLEVQVPFSVAGTGASILGIAGGTAQNKLDNFLPPAIGDLSPESVADYVVVAPRLGVGATWKGGGFDVSALYRFNQVEDTFFADRSVFYGHHGATEAGFYGETAARQLARSLGVRAKAGLSWIYSPYAQAGAAPNLLTSLAAEARVGSLLAASPSTTLDLSVSASWEDASATADDYWAPPGILSVKGGPSLAARFGSPEGSEVSVATRLWPGLYSAEGDGRLSLDGELSLGFAKRGLSLSLSVAGGWTQATATAAQYWSGSVGLGLKAAVGDYIIP